MPPVRSASGRSTAIGLGTAIALLVLAALPAATLAQDAAAPAPTPVPAAAPPIPPPLPVPRLTGEITLDGDLSEPAWQSSIGRAHPLVGKVWDVAAGRFVNVV